MVSYGLENKNALDNIYEALDEVEWLIEVIEWNPNEEDKAIARTVLNDISKIIMHLVRGKSETSKSLNNKSANDNACS